MWRRSDEHPHTVSINRYINVTSNYECNGSVIKVNDDGVSSTAVPGPV